MVKRYRDDLRTVTIPYEIVAEAQSLDINLSAACRRGLIEEIERKKRSIEEEVQ